MMEMTTFTSQLQVANWGWTIAIFLWLVGLSGMGFFLNYWVRNKWLIWVCTASGLMGTLLVVSHLARILNLPIAAFSSIFSLALNFGSWMLIGICLLALLCIASMAWSVLAAGYFVKSEEQREDIIHSPLLCGFFAVLGILCTIYSGFLLTQAIGISLWNSALIPLLWIMSGMASSIGCIELLMITGLIPEERVVWSRKTSFWVEVAELFTIFAFLHVAAYSNLAGARAGAESLLSGHLSPMFWVGVILLGSVIPLSINLITKNHRYIAVSAVLGIIGALLLRASVLFAGCYEPAVF